MYETMATFPLMFLMTLFLIGLGNMSLVAKVVLHWETLQIVWLEGRIIAYGGVRVINYSFVFMLNKDFALRSNPRTHFVEMLSVDELSRGGDGGEIIRNLVFSPDGETLYVMDRVSNGTLITAWNV